MITEDRRTHLAHVVVDGIWKDDLVDYANEDEAIRIAKRAMQKFVDELDAVDQKARTMVSSLKRDVQEGTPEWDVLYAKYFEEELKRRSGSN